MIYFISDTHWGHKNIIEYTNRPFSSIEEMNQALIDNWNNIVKEDDIVIHVGDVIFKGKIEEEELLSSLNGEKILIFGNHDERRIKNAKGWVQVGGSLTFEHEGYRFFIRHHPFDTDKVNSCSEKSIFIHGHKHSKYGIFNARQFDVSVEGWNYSPVSINTLIEYYEKYTSEKHTSSIDIV